MEGELPSVERQSAPAETVGFAIVVARRAWLLVSPALQALAAVPVLLFVALLWGSVLVLVGAIIGVLVGGVIEAGVNMVLPEQLALAGQMQIAVGVAAVLIWSGDVASRSQTLAAVRRTGLRRFAADRVRPAVDAWRDRWRAALYRRPVALPQPGVVDGAGVAGLGDPLFSAQAFVGWRLWKLRPGPGAGDEPEPLLGSAVLELAWSGAHIEARCESAKAGPFYTPAYRTVLDADHSPPEVGCTCGIYALKEEDRAGPRPAGVWAEGHVRLWGRVIEGSRGYRAQHARIEGPLRLHVSCVAASGWLRLRCPNPARWVMTGPDGYSPVCAHHAPAQGANEAGRAWVGDFADSVANQLERRYGLSIVVEGVADGYR